MAAIEKRGICVVPGIKAAGIASGIKPNGKLDFAAIVSDEPADVAAVFTRNRVQAAPVIVSKRNLKHRRARVVLISSGNANAATGEAGLRLVEQICESAATQVQCLPREVLIAQTGLIGIPLDEAVALRGSQQAISAVSAEGGIAAANAILTTDTKVKLAQATLVLDGKEVTVAGMAKGAAMLAPSLATMIVLLASDASVDAAVLQHALNDAVQDSFHMMSVDGCTSTNDTVFLLANGSSGSSRLTSKGSGAYNTFVGAVREVCESLAKQMAADGEGATKFLTVKVTGARNPQDARKAARAVSRSLLVKCSLAGENAYWGRVLSELGASGAEFRPEEVVISYGPHVVCKHGMALAHDENAVDLYMKQREIVITADIGNGNAQATAYGCDLTHGYVDENMAKS